LIAALPVEADVRTFETPEHAGYSVSSCASANGVCGERVADLWCRQQGFERVVDWSVRLGRDFSTATVTLDGGTICRGAQCESFASISCETQGRSFRMPALGGLARSTLITPDRRNAEVAAAPIEYEVSVPGCQQREPCTFMCESLEEYPELLADPKGLRDAYLAEMSAFRTRLAAACLAERIDLVELNTRTPLDVALSSYLARRAAMRRR
jgi:hypothetical protein